MHCKSKETMTSAALNPQLKRQRCESDVQNVGHCMTEHLPPECCPETVGSIGCASEFGTLLPPGNYIFVILHPCDCISSSKAWCVASLNMPVRFFLICILKRSVHPLVHDCLLDLRAAHQKGAHCSISPMLAGGVRKESLATIPSQFFPAIVWQIAATFARKANTNMHKTENASTRG